MRLVRSFALQYQQIANSSIFLQLWGLATHPTGSHLAVTGGDDKTIRVWDLHKKALVNKTQLDTMCRTIDWSPDGALIGLGLGGRIGRKVRQKDGAHEILRADNLVSNSIVLDVYLFQMTWLFFLRRTLCIKDGTPKNGSVT